MKASDLFLKCLEAEGVDVIFGLPGEENADLMISMLDLPVEFITCRHEQAAAFMADIYGRLTGKPGVCLGTLGPGATNLATGIANANMDRSPVVGVVGQAGTYRLHKESHQAMDAISMFKPITKWTTSIYEADNVPEVVHKAFKLAAAEKPGACIVELPENIAKENSERKPFKQELKVRRPVGDEKAVRQALDLIAASSKPIILVGNGCARTRAAKQVNIFIEKTGIYAVNTFMAKGVVSARNDRCLFAAGLASRDHVSRAFAAADLVIAIGYDMVEWHPSLWNIGNQKKILHIDFLPAEVDENYRTSVEVVGDIASSLWEINEGITAAHQKETPEFSLERERMLRELRSVQYEESQTIKPQRVLWELRELMADDDIVISDVGAHKIWTARLYPAYEPNTCIISNGFCSMGIAVPGAISAKRLFPHKKIVGLCGDGGFIMNVQELATAVEHKIPAVFLIWDDGGYGLIKWKQEAHYGKTSNWSIKNPNWVKLAESFGCRGIEVSSPSEFTPAMKAAFAETERPTVVSLKIDYAENMKLTKRLGDIIAR